MFPKRLNVSYSCLLSMPSCKFLTKMFPRPLRRTDGSRWDHMMRHGLDLMSVKFMLSRARSASGAWW